MLAVSKNFRGRKIAQRLVEHGLEASIDYGYSVAVTEATNLASQKVFRRIGFEDRFEIRYDSFSYENERPFKAISEHPSIILMEKDLVIRDGTNQTT